MSAGARAAVVSVGAVTPVGLSAPATCAALRAGIARLGELPVADPVGAGAGHGPGPGGGMETGADAAPEPVIGGRVPTERLRPHADGEPVVPRPVSPAETRLSELALPAAREALHASALAADARVGLYVALAETESKAFVRTLAPELVPVPRLGAAFTSGRAGIFAALARAANDLAEGTISRALVGGVDSLVRPDVIERMAEETAARGLAGADPPAGDAASVVPGECAAFLVLARAADVHAVDRVELLGIATGEEPTCGTDAPSQAEGLTRVLHATRAASEPIPAPPLVVCDLNGERYRALEWAMASLRVLGALGGARDVWHPADCIGDSGAGAGALSLVWATTALRRGYAGASDAIVWGASDGTLRGSALLRTGTGGG